MFHRSANLADERRRLNRGHRRRVSRKAQEKARRMKALFLTETEEAWRERHEGKRVVC
jgi:hypothetical protein